MAKEMTLRAVVKFIGSDFTKGARKMLGQLQQLKGAIQTTFAIGSLAAFGRGIVSATKNFEDSMARVQAVSNATSGEFKMMRDEALKLGASTRYTATQVANTLEVLTRNGFNAEKATKSLAGVLQLAQANAVGLADAGNMMTNTLNMFGLSVKDVQRVNDVFSSTVSNTATNLQDLYDALVNAAPMAHALGFSIEETVSALGALAQRGIKGADAGTQLRMALQKLVDPAAVKKMKEYGVELDENTVKAKGLQYVLKTLNDANLSISALNEIFTVRSSKAVLQLVNSMDDFNRVLKITQDSAGTTFRMFTEGVGSVRYELDVLRSVWENFLITIGEASKGPFNSILRWAQNTITAFKTWGGTLANFGAIIALAFTGKIPKIKEFFSSLSALRTKDTLEQKLADAEYEKSMFKKIAAQKQFGKTSMETAKANVAAKNAEITAIKSEIAAVNNLKTTLKSMAISAAWMAAVVAIQALVTWLISLNRELKEAKQALKDADKEAEKLTTEVDVLKNMIGKGDNEASLNGAVKKAIEIFPQFADVIKNAANEAGKTKNYEKLKTLLTDITALQTKVVKRDALQGVINANVNKLGRNLYKNSGLYNITTTLELKLKDEGFNKDEIQSVFDDLGRILITYQDSPKQQVDLVKALLDGYGIKKTNQDIQNFIGKVKLGTPNASKTATGTPTYSENGYNQGGDALRKYMGVSEQVEQSEGKIRFDDAWAEYIRLSKEAAKDFGENTKEYKERMSELVDALEEKTKDLTLSPNDRYNVEYQRKLYPSRKTTATSSAGGGSSSNSKGKTEQDKFNDTIKEYTEEVAKNKNLLESGVLTQKQYDAEIAKLTQDTVELIAGFSDLEGKIKNIPKQFHDTATELTNKIKDLPQLRVETIFTEYGAKRETLETAKSQTTDPEQIKSIDKELEDLAVKTHEALLEVSDFESAINNASDAVKDFAKQLNSDIDNINEKKKNEEREKLKEYEPKTRGEIINENDLKKTELPVKIQPYFDEYGFRKDTESKFENDPVNVALDGDDSIEALKYKLNKLLDKNYEITLGIENAKVDLSVQDKMIDDTKKKIEDLKNAIEKGDFSTINETFKVDTLGEADTLLQNLKNDLVALQSQMTSMKDKLELAELIKQTQDMIESLKSSTLDNISSMASAFDRLYDGIKNISEAFGEEIEWEGLEKGMSVINGVIQIMESLKTMIETVRTVEQIANAQAVKSNAEKALSNIAVAETEAAKASAAGVAAGAEIGEAAATEVGATANDAKAVSDVAVAATTSAKAAAAAGAAVAEGTESVAKIPYVGAILAVAAAASIAAALFAAMGKFANGGIIGGNSTHGDQNVVRVNSREMILNRAQQGNLYRAIAEGNIGGGTVEFKISGPNLVGVLKNNHRLWNK